MRMLSETTQSKRWKAENLMSRVSKRMKIMRGKKTVVVVSNGQKPPT